MPLEVSEYTTTSVAACTYSRKPVASQGSLCMHRAYVLMIPGGIHAFM